jgi:hypothetical protein
MVFRKNPAAAVYSAVATSARSRGFRILEKPKNVTVRGTTSFAHSVTISTRHPTLEHPNAVKLLQGIARTAMRNTEVTHVPVDSSSERSLTLIFHHPKTGRK